MIMVYIMILDELTGYKNVCEANKLHSDALNDYLINGFTEERKYSNFSIAPFNTTGLKGDYLDIYHFIKEDNTICLCGYINRTTGPI